MLSIYFPKLETVCCSLGLNYFKLLQLIPLVSIWFVYLDVICFLARRTRSRRSNYRN